MLALFWVFYFLIEQFEDFQLNSNFLKSEGKNQ